MKTPTPSSIYREREMVWNQYNGAKWLISGDLELCIAFHRGELNTEIQDQDSARVLVCCKNSESDTIQWELRPRSHRSSTSRVLQFRAARAWNNGITRPHTTAVVWSLVEHKNRLLTLLTLLALHRPNQTKSSRSRKSVVNREQIRLEKCTRVQSQARRRLDSRLWLVDDSCGRGWEKNFLHHHHLS